MLIKLKNNLTVDLSDPLQNHLKNISSLSERRDYIEKKLEAACRSTELIKKNTHTPEKIPKHSDPLETTKAKDNLVVFSKNIVGEIAQNSKAQQQTIIEYLSKQAELRKENQLVYGKSLSNSNLIGLGVGLAENLDNSNSIYYKKKLRSTGNFTYPMLGIVEFGITYDNKIFIVPKSDDAIAHNLYKLAQGTLLKAVGCLQIGKEIEESVEGTEAADPKLLEGQLHYISVYNSVFDVPKDNIAISLFALKQLGIDLSNTQVVVPNDEGQLINRDSGCKISIHGNLENASYYLNEKRFPGAKTLAEKKSNFADKIIELFYTIDDEVLSTGHKKLIKDIHGEKELLKLNLIKLFNCCEELEQTPKENSKKVESRTGLFKNINQPSTSSQAIAEQISVSTTKAEETVTGTFNDYWQSIKTSLQLFKEKNIDLSFLVSEIKMIVAYLLQNNLTVGERDQLKEWEIPGIIPGRGLDPEAISDYIKFYQHNPIKTCFALLQDYSKGRGWRGKICRFFKGAWKRNYSEPVNKLLMTLKNNELPDNINICGIYQGLKDSGLIFNYDAENKSSLRKILLFCAELNDEESGLLHRINTLSITSFPPLDSDSCNRCIERCC